MKQPINFYWGHPFGARCSCSFALRSFVHGGHEVRRNNTFFMDDVRQDLSIGSRHNLEVRILTSSDCALEFFSSAASHVPLRAWSIEVLGGRLSAGLSAPLGPAT